MKNFKLLFCTAVFCLLINGCGTMIGTTVTSKKNPKFSPAKYSRFFINATDKQLCFSPTKEALLSQGLIPYDGKNRESTIFAYMRDSSGLCIPQFNTKYPLWFRFVFPKTAKVQLKDAETSETLLEVNYERGYFSTGSGEELCVSSVKDELEKVFKKTMLKDLPKPIDLMNKGSLEK